MERLIAWHVERAREWAAQRQADRDQIELSIHTTRTGPCR